MSRKNKENYTDRDYSYNSRSRASGATRSFVFLDSAKQKSPGRIAGIIVAIIFFLALLATAAWLILKMTKAVE